MKNTTKPKTIDYFSVPRVVWRLFKKWLPKARKGRRGRPPADNRSILNGIWYVLWTGCQWKAVHRRWFGVCSSVLHERFQRWQKAGRWDKLHQAALRYYHKQRGIAWTWQSVDSKACPAPLGGEASGRNPTDRGKRGSKIHILVEARGAPLALHVTGANQHDKWAVADLLFALVVPKPGGMHHFCADKGYDYDDVFELVRAANYVPHIKHRRRRNEPPPEPVPVDQLHPARRWVVERSFSWLTKRRSLRTR